ncbi:hypothetical protein VP01_4041g1 [Puccinia sorghi]|uniref:Uncharacterized protein n=1 Tax=Puccinia sorghi TaxID=27349 RepID=A0A0L6UTL5_9BASI|nr:hypothetical protein VP01_4041g1 [Puccinia sorghi]
MYRPVFMLFDVNVVNNSCNVPGKTYRMALDTKCQELSPGESQRRLMFQCLSLSLSRVPHFRWGVFPSTLRWKRLRFFFVKQTCRIPGIGARHTGSGLRTSYTRPTTGSQPYFIVTGGTEIYVYTMGLMEMRQDRVSAQGLCAASERMSRNEPRRYASPDEALLNCANYIHSGPRIALGGHSYGRFGENGDSATDEDSGFPQFFRIGYLRHKPVGSKSLSIPVWIFLELCRALASPEQRVLLPLFGSCCKYFSITFSRRIKKKIHNIQYHFRTTISFASCFMGASNLPALGSLRALTLAPTRPAERLTSISSTWRSPPSDDPLAHKPPPFPAQKPCRRLVEHIFTSPPFFSFFSLLTRYVLAARPRRKMKMNGPAIRWLVVLTVHLCHVLPLRGAPLFGCCGGSYGRMKNAVEAPMKAAPESMHSGGSSAEMSGEWHCRDAGDRSRRAFKGTDSRAPGSCLQGLSTPLGRSGMALRSLKILPSADQLPQTKRSGRRRPPLPPMSWNGPPVLRPGQRYPKTRATLSTAKIPTTPILSPANTSPPPKDSTTTNPRLPSLLHEPPQLHWLPFRQYLLLPLHTKKATLVLSICFAYQTHEEVSNYSSISFLRSKKLCPWIRNLLEECQPVLWPQIFPSSHRKSFRTSGNGFVGGTQYKKNIVEEVERVIFTEKDGRCGAYIGKGVTVGLSSCCR